MDFARRKVLSPNLRDEICKKGFWRRIDIISAEKKAPSGARNQVLNVEEGIQPIKAGKGANTYFKIVPQTYFPVFAAGANTGPGCIRTKQC